MLDSSSPEHMNFIYIPNKFLQSRVYMPATGCKDPKKHYYKTVGERVMARPASQFSHELLDKIIAYSHLRALGPLPSCGDTVHNTRYYLPVTVICEGSCPCVGSILSTRHHYLLLAHKAQLFPNIRNMKSNLLF